MSATGRKLTLEGSNVEYHIDIPDNDPKPPGMKMLRVICRLLPTDGLEGVMRCRNHFQSPSHPQHLVFEHVIRHGVDHSLMKVWPAVECALANHHLCDIGGLPAVVLGRDRNDHRLISAIGLEDVDVMEAQCTLMRQRFKRREAGKG